MTGASSAEPEVKSPPVMGRLEDTTPYFAPMGELVIDRARDRVRCRLCGGWYRALASTHLRSHGWDHREYSAAFGLFARRPLKAPGLVAAHRVTLW